MDSAVGPRDPTLASGIELSHLQCWVRGQGVDHAGTNTTLQKEHELLPARL